MVLVQVFIPWKSANTINQCSANSLISPPSPSNWYSPNHWEIVCFKSSQDIQMRRHRSGRNSWKNPDLIAPGRMNPYRKEGVLPEGRTLPPQPQALFLASLNLDQGLFQRGLISSCLCICTVVIWFVFIVLLLPFYSVTFSLCIVFILLLFSSFTTSRFCWQTGEGAGPAGQAKAFLLLQQVAWERPWSWTQTVRVCGWSYFQSQLPMILASSAEEVCEPRRPSWRLLNKAASPQKQ